MPAGSVTAVHEIVNGCCTDAPAAGASSVGAATAGGGGGGAGVQPLSVACALDVPSATVILHVGDENGDFSIRNAPAPGGPPDARPPSTVTAWLGTAPFPSPRSPPLFNSERVITICVTAAGGALCLETPVGAVMRPCPHPNTRPTTSAIQRIRRAGMKVLRPKGMGRARFARAIGILDTVLWHSHQVISTPAADSMRLGERHPGVCIPVPVDSASLAGILVPPVGDEGPPRPPASRFGAGHFLDGAAMTARALAFA